MGPNHVIQFNRPMLYFHSSVWLVVDESDTDRRIWRRCVMIAFHLYIVEFSMFKGPSD